MLKKISEYASKFVSIRGVAGFVIWIMFMMLMMKSLNGFFYEVNQTDYNDVTANFYDLSLSETIMQQELVVDGYVQKMSFIMKNRSDVPQNLYMTLYEGDGVTEITSTVIEVAASAGAELIIDWNVNRTFESGQELVLELKSDCPPETLMASMQDKSFDSIYYENGVLTDAHVRMSVVYDVQLKMDILLCCAVLVVLTGCVFFMKFIRNISIEYIFAVVALMAGVVFAFINPFGQEPDGWVHFTRAMDVSYGNWLAPFVDNNGSSMVMNLPTNIHDIGFRKVETTGADAVWYMKNIKSLWLSEELVPIEGLGGFAALFYAPQALGLCVGRALGMNVYGLMVWGRIFNLLAYVSLTFFGLKKMPLYRNIFLAVALMPMTIYQAASFSYDGVLMGLCFLFIGLCFYFAYEKESLSWKDVIVLGFILGLLCLCKYVYVCIGLLVFLIPMKKFGGVKEYWKSFVIALVPFFVIVGVMFISSAMISVPTETISEDGGTQITALGFVMENPKVLIMAIVRTIPMYFSYYIEHLSTLGWLNFVLEPLRYLLPVFLCVVAVLDTKEVSEKQGIKDKVLCFCTFAITVLAGLVGLYLMDSIANPIGAITVQGYQGRYTIPVLMLLLMTMASVKVENKIDDFSYKVMGIMSMFLCFTAVILVFYCY